MTISVIVPTYNGAHKITNVLSALERQTMHDFNTIVVVDGSTDNTLEVLKNTNFQLKDLVVIFQENRGRAAVRNKGAKEAKGEFLVFFDDDMRPSPNCLASHIIHYRQYPESIAVGTQINDWAKATTEMQKYRCYFSRKWEKNLIGKHKAVSELNNGNLYITAANFSLKRDTFLKLGGFDERLNDAEDYDFAVRANKSGVPIFYLPDAYAWHDENYSLASYIRRRKGYVRAHQLLVKLKPELYQQYTHRKFGKKRGFKKVVFWFFSLSFWVSSIDKLNLFRWMPAVWRFRLYDLIITSAVIYFPRRA